MVLGPRGRWAMAYYHSHAAVDIWHAKSVHAFKVDKLNVQ